MHTRRIRTARAREARRRRHRRLFGWAWLRRRGHDFVVAAMFLAIFGAGGLYLRLTAGPMSLGDIGQVIAGAVNRDFGARRLQVGDVVLSLGRGGTESGLRFRDVTVFGADGEVVAKAPEISVGFTAFDLLQGKLAPQRIGLDGVDATLVRRKDGRFAFDFSTRSGDTLPQDQTAGLFTLLEPTGEGGGLDSLEAITATDVQLVYVDERFDRRLTADDARIVVRRGAAGLEGFIYAAITDQTGATSTVSLSGWRAYGGDETRLDARIEGGRARAVASQLGGLAWLERLDARLSGDVRARIGDDGVLRGMNGSLRLDDIAFEPRADADPLIASGAIADTASFNFALDGSEERVNISRLEVDGPHGRVSGGGFARLLRDTKGAPSGMAGEVDFDAVEMRGDDLFADPLRFDSGKLGVRVHFDPLRVEIGEARLGQGDTRLTARGAAGRGADGWSGEVDFSAVNADTADLAAFWPVFAARSARDWVAANISGGRLTSVDGAARFGPAGVKLGLDFAFDGVRARYIKEMPPILDGAGVGRMTENSLLVAVRSGRVEVGDGDGDGGGEVAVGPSTFAIPDLFVKNAPANVELSASGATADVLALVDSEPLRLVSKLGADIGRVGGTAQVEASLAFPLIKELKTSDVAASVSADLADVRLSAPFADAAVASPALKLEADTDQLEVTGPVTLAGFDARLDWVERFRPEPGEPQSRFDISGRVGADDLARLGDTPITISDGAAPATIRLQIARDGPARFDARVDLGPVAAAIPALGWSKEAGAPGGLTASGALGERSRIDAFALDADGLRAAGSATLGADGAPVSVKLAELKVGEAADVALDWRRGAELDTATVSGRLIDAPWLAGLSESGGMAGARPLTADIELERLRLSDGIALTDVTGTVSTDAAAGVTAEVSGMVNGGQPARVTISPDPGGRRLRVTAEDAGEVLRNLDLYRTGFGGALDLTALLAPSGRIEGMLSAGGIIVRDAPVLAQMLSIASLIGLLDQLGSGGITFTTVEAPFVIDGGKVYLHDAKAFGPSIGVTVAGDYDMETEALDLQGVITPAFLLNAILSEVPLIGDILSGGSGEGVFGFNYAVAGPRGDPEVSVNPLSVLTPGVFRRALSGEAPAPPPAPAPDGGADEAPERSAEAAPPGETKPTPPPRVDSQRQRRDMR